MSFKPYRTFVWLPQGVVDNLGKAQIFISLLPETQELSIAVVPQEERVYLAPAGPDPHQPELIWINPRNVVQPVSSA